MYRVALNTAISFLKKDQTKLKRSSSEQLENFKMEPFDPVMEERIAWLYQNIQELNVVEKGIILLYLEGRNYEEISNITGFSTTNIGTRISRIKQKLKNQIKKEAIPNRRRYSSGRNYITHTGQQNTGWN